MRMDKSNNTTNQGRKSIPKGLQLLRGSKQSEEFTKEYLNQCCNSYPQGCAIEYKTECKHRYDKWCGEWDTFNSWKEPSPRITEERRYANTLPTLSIRTVMGIIRERSIY
jgi:hypothetical protein